MTDALKFEVKKDGWNQLQSGSYKLALTLNPADLDDNAQALLLEFVKAPMGTRYMMGMAEIGDDEQPVGRPVSPADSPKAKPPPEPFHTLPRSQQAGMACGDAEFQKWICHGASNANADMAAMHLRSVLAIKSRAQLNETTPGYFSGDGEKWDTLYAQFQADTGRTAEQRR